MARPKRRRSCPAMASTTSSIVLHSWRSWSVSRRIWVLLFIALDSSACLRNLIAKVLATKATTNIVAKVLGYSFPHASKE